jgi:hypothetical protein
LGTAPAGGRQIYVLQLVVIAPPFYQLQQLEQAKQQHSGSLHILHLEEECENSLKRIAPHVGAVCKDHEDLTCFLCMRAFRLQCA